MMHNFVAATAVAALALGIPAAAGARSGVMGAAIASLTAFASLAAFRLFGRSAVKALQRALAVFVAMFLLRLALVAPGLLHVVRAGEDRVAFVVAFFASYFAFAAIEGSYLHFLGRSMGKTA